MNIKIININICHVICFIKKTKALLTIAYAVNIGYSLISIFGFKRHCQYFSVVIEARLRLIAQIVRCWWRVR